VKIDPNAVQWDEGPNFDPRMIVWNSPQQYVSDEAADAAAQGVGGLQALTIAAGRGANKIKSGLRQLSLKTTAASDTPVGLRAREELLAMAEEQAAQDQAYGGIERARPFTAAVGEALPNMAVPGSAGIPALMAGNAMLEGLKFGTDSERGLRAGVGALTSGVGSLAGNAVGKMIYPIVKPMSETAKNALRIGKDLGLSPRLSQVTGSQTLARMEDAAGRMPGGAQTMADFAGLNQTAANTAAARSIGETSPELTQKTFEAARTRIGGVFDQVSQLGKIIKIDQNVGKVAQDVFSEASKAAPEFKNGTIISLAQRAMDLAKNRARMDGMTYKKLREDLSAAAYGASGSDANLFGRLLGAIDGAADDSLKAAGKGDLAGKLKTARKEYGNLLALEKGMVAEGGDVSLARAASVLRQKNPAGFREGRMAGDPLYDAALFGESFKPLAGGSQTAERMAMGDLMSLARAPYYYGVSKVATSPKLIGYSSMLAAPQGAAQGILSRGAQSFSGIANPATRAALQGILTNQPLSFLESQ